MTVPRPVREAMELMSGAVEKAVHGAVLLLLAGRARRGERGHAGDRAGREGRGERVQLGGGGLRGLEGGGGGIETGQSMYVCMYASCCV